jgi:hypothetical protein
MDWVWQPTELEVDEITVPALYELETAASAFLTNLFQAAPAFEEPKAEVPVDTVATLFLAEEIVLSISLQVRQQLERNGRQVLETIVACQYLSFDGLPIDLPSILIQVVNRNEPIDNNASEALRNFLTNAIGEAAAPSISLSFRQFDDSQQVLESVPGTADGHSKTDKALIVSTSFLSVMVVIVSSVLLYITGGWSACQRTLNHCLFEEVEDDYDYPRKTNTFQDSNSNSESYDEEAAESDDESGSVETGFGTAMTQDGNPTAGLGIKTPSRGTYNNNVDMTPMSEMTAHDNDAPLGITSMRKLPMPETPEVDGGLAHMIMERVAKVSGFSTTTSNKIS